VTRGPDQIWNGDIRHFHPPARAFWGVFGGSPCQDFSAARRAPPTGNGVAMLTEFARVVRDASPEWYLLENVPSVPDLRIDGYKWQRIDIDQGWYSGVSRLRHWQFGSKSGRVLDIPKGRPVVGAEPAALANDGRTFRELCRLQGLPDSFDLPGFTVQAKKAAVGNGVPLVMGLVLANAVRTAYGLDAPSVPAFDATACERRRCQCGCGRVVKGKASYDSPACRKRAQRRRE
jgi:DNA (cytosine-5)-methyltransferase 1